MATPLDIFGTQQFSWIFPFLFVLVLVYAILAWTPMFSEKKGIAGMLAFIAAVMTSLSSITIKTINLMAPWFVLFLIFGVLMILAYMAFGIDKDTIFKTLTGAEHGGSFAMWVISIMLLIGVGSLFTVINEEVGFRELAGDNITAERPSEQFGFWQTIFHPKVLGMILILMIAYFTIGKMSSSL